MIVKLGMKTAQKFDMHRFILIPIKPNLLRGRDGKRRVF
jgi:hypothetical protein